MSLIAFASSGVSLPTVAEEVSAALNAASPRSVAAMADSYA